MQRSRKRGGLRITPEQFEVDHPFIRWYASYWTRGAARCQERPGSGLSGDLFMGELAASRFSLGVDDDRVPVLGVADDDAAAIMSVPWTGAAFLRRVRRRDWIALVCHDARIEGSGTATPVQLRLWLPAAIGLLDGWIGVDPVPASLRVIEAAIRKGKPQPKGGGVLAVLPLSFKGMWERETAAA